MLDDAVVELGLEVDGVGVVGGDADGQDAHKELTLAPKEPELTHHKLKLVTTEVLMAQ